MTTLATVVVAHRQKQLAVRDRLNAFAKAAWARVEPGDVVGSWMREAPPLIGVTQRALALSAAGSTQYVSGALLSQGLPSSPEATVVPQAFAETAADGRPLASLLISPATKAQRLIDAGNPIEDVLSAGFQELSMMLSTEFADAGRGGVSSAMLADRRVTGYYREPGPAACARCAVLAGKWYSTFEGAAFERHPRCMCSAVPAERGRGNPIAKSPEDYFASLSRTRQDAVFTKAGAEAIREGADISQVVNARRGMSAPGSWTTTESTTRHGLYGGTNPSKARLTPTAIFRLSGTRDEAVSMLREYGYLR